MVSQHTPKPTTAPKSRASTTLLDDTGPDTPLPFTQLAVVTPPVSASPGSETACAKVQISEEGFKPFQLLMETEVTVEFGKDGRSKRVIHEELLCCHSKKQYNLFKKAKSMRDAYERGDKLRKHLKLFVLPRMTAANIEEEQLEDKVTLLIARICDQYPTEKRSQLKKLVDAGVDDQVGKRNFVDKSVPKKDLKSMDILSQLRNLNAKGVSNIAQSLANELRSIKVREKEAAKTNPLKAAAQRRIILPDVDEGVVRALSTWLYQQGAMNYESAEDLYALQALAEKLGVLELAEQCLTKLANGAEETIRFALRQGATLHQLFGLGSEQEDDQEPIFPTGNIAEIVVHCVLKDDQAPARLRTLVVEILAEHLDAELWAQLRHTTTHSMALLIIESMLRRDQIKNELINPTMETDI